MRDEVPSVCVCLCVFIIESYIANLCSHAEDLNCFNVIS